MVKRPQNGDRGFQQVSGWQRFPSEFALEGWLRPDHPKAVPHSSLSTLLALYAQLLDRNRQSPKLKGGRIEIDEKQLALDAGVADVARELDILEERGLVVRGQGSTMEVRDPVSASWPPRKFATLPARFVVEHLPQLRAVSSEQKIDIGKALALYVVMLAQRNSKTGEVWYSSEKTPRRAGLDSKGAEEALGALMHARFVTRPTLSRIWVYQICGLEPSSTGTAPVALHMEEPPARTPALRGQRRPKTTAKPPRRKKPAPGQ